MPDNETPTNTALGCTGLTTDTPARMQLDAGVFFENLSYSSATNAATFKAALDAAITARTGSLGNLLGATRGGGTFVATPTTREPEIDGKRPRVKGLIRYDTWDVRLTGTMVEAYPGNFKRALGPADVTTSGSVDTLTLRTQAANSDYLDHVQWVSLLGDGTYMVVEIDNAINLDGVTFTFQDKNEGTIPFNFGATQGSLAGGENAPFRIKYFHPAT
jgi:hypothetical protein